VYPPPPDVDAVDIDLFDLMLPPPPNSGEEQTVYPPPPDVDAVDIDPFDSMLPPASDPIPILEPDDSSLESLCYPDITWSSYRSHFEGVSGVCDDQHLRKSIVGFRKPSI
jgi:hypothetical protein